LSGENPGVTNLSVSNTLYAVETPRTLMLTKLLSPESDPKIQRTRTLPLGKSEKLTHTEGTHQRGIE